MRRTNAKGAFAPPCSFCARTKREVRFLFTDQRNAQPVAICNVCARLFASLLKTDARAVIPQGPRAPR